MDAPICHTLAGPTQMPRVGIYMAIHWAHNEPFLCSIWTPLFRLHGGTHTKATGKTARWLLYGHPSSPSRRDPHKNHGENRAMVLIWSPQFAFTAGPTQEPRGKPRDGFYMVAPRAHTELFLCSVWSPLFRLHGGTHTKADGVLYGHPNNVSSCSSHHGSAP